MSDRIKALLAPVLIDKLPQGVKDSIDRLLAAGESKPRILAAEAYLETK